MTENSPAPNTPSKPALLKLGLAHLATLLVTFGMLGGVLFLSAGRVDWPAAWVILAVYFLIALGAGGWMLRYDPQLLKERQQAITKSNIKKWDRLMVALNLLLSLALYAVIGLDAGRWQFSHVPLVVRSLGGLAALASFGLSLWAASVNTYMSAQVRIQAERDHHAVTRGPYAHIRHPMYLGMCLLDLGLPLVFGSWLGLLVSLLMIAAVVIRTRLEDATLRGELPGYAEYAAQVRYRLMPGVW
jgi:protein-S-isoprenylcysteine O-methyltransferase Ste14